MAIMPHAICPPPMIYLGKSTFLMPAPAAGPSQSFTLTFVPQAPMILSGVARLDHEPFVHGGIPKRDG